MLSILYEDNHIIVVIKTVWNHKAEKALPRTWSVRYENTWPVIHKISTN